MVGKDQAVCLESLVSFPEKTVSGFPRGILIGFSLKISPVNGQRNAFPFTQFAAEFLVIVRLSPS